MRLIILLFLSFITFSFSQNLPSSFSFLKTLELDDGHAFVHFNEKISKVLNKKIFIEEAYIEIVQAVKTKIDYRKQKKC